MTSYRKDYSAIPEGPARDLAALVDAQEFLEEERFSVIVTELGAVDEMEDAEMALSFAGVSGLPARAMWRFSRGFKD